MPERHPKPCKPRRRLLAALLLTLTSFGRSPAQDTTPPLEYQVKAAFLFNFARFIEWPPETFRGRQDAFLVCVVDDETFARAFDLVVSGRTVDGRVLKVRRLHAADDASSCRMLYLGSAQPPRLAALLKSVQATAILTVGDIPGFTRQGGVINFVMQDNRVHFEINPDAARRAGLRISSKLLQLATIVEDATPAEDER